jgi:hypothetical protein
VLGAGRNQTYNAANQILAFSIDANLSAAGTPSFWTVLNTSYNNSSPNIGVNIDQSGQIHIFIMGTDNLTGVSITRGVWNHYELDVNFIDDTVSAFYNGAPVLQGAAFSQTGTTLMGYQFYAQGGSPLVGTDSGYFDNLSATASATPATTLTVSVQVTPATAAIQTGQTQQFTATVTGTTNTAVNWSVGGIAGGNSTVGTISAGGLFTAPATVPNPSTVTITVTSAADSTKSASATVTIAAAPNSVQVSVSPSSATVATGGAQQFTATVTGTTNTAVTWSVNGIAGGNPAVGTISASGLYTAPATVPNPNNVAVTATSTADSTRSASAMVTVSVPTGGLAITSVSSSSPMPLTPLTISTTGLNANLPVQVQFSNVAGFSVSEPAISVASDGTVVAAVPVYANADGTTSSGAVSVVVTQGTQSTAPVSLSIQDLPPVSSYGTQPGQISVAFLDFLTLSLSQRINELQAFKALPGDQVDTSQEQSNLNQILSGVLQARQEVSRVAADNSLVINGGTLADGTPVQFDQTSLDMMDRTIAVYLTQLSPVISAAAPGNSVAVSGRLAMADGRRQQSVQPLASSGACSSSRANMACLLQLIQTAANVASIAQAWQTTAHDDNTVVDKALAVAGGVQGVLGFAAQITANPSLVRFAAAYGAGLSVAAVANDVANESVALGYIIKESYFGTGDPTTLQTAQQVLDDTQTRLKLDLLQEGVSFLDYGTQGVFEAYTGGFNTYLKKLANQAKELALQSSSFILSTAQIAHDRGYSQEFETALQAAAQLASPFTSAQQGFAAVYGKLGGAATPPAVSGIAISSHKTDTFTTMADSSGGYSLTIPLQDPNFDYANATVNVFTPLGLVPLGRATASLSTLASSASLLLPFVNIAPAACTLQQLTAWDHICTNQFNNLSNACSSIQGLLQQNQCINAALRAWENCVNACVP